MPRRGNLLDLIEGTLRDIQTNNKNNPKERTAEPSVFDLIKNKIREVNDKVVINQPTNDGQKKPSSIFDIIQDKIEDARKENHDNPKEETAPSSIFDLLKNKVKEHQQTKRKKVIQRVEESIEDVIQEYNLDVSNISPQEMQQISQKYMQDNANMDRQYAKYISELNAKNSNTVRFR